MTEGNPTPENVESPNLYSTLTKDKLGTNPNPPENEMLKDVDPNQIPDAEREEINIDDNVQWQSLKERWDNIGGVYQRLNQCIEALRDEDNIIAIQQLDNAKMFIAHAKAELEKAFDYECKALAHETKIPPMLETPWAVNIKSKPRKSKENKESVYFQKEHKDEGDEDGKLKEDTRN